MTGEGLTNFFFFFTGDILLFSVTGNQHTLFHLNSRTGIITQQTSVLEAGLSDDEFRLVIEVIVVLDLQQRKYGIFGLILKNQILAI